MTESMYSEGETNNYPVISVIALVLVFVAAPLFWVGLQSEVPAVRALAIIVLPASILGWIFTTVRALHLCGLRYWSMGSTYASMIFFLIALVCAWIGYGTQPKGPHIEGDPTLFIVAAFVAGLTLLGCAWQNWRATRSAALAVSLTALQVVSTAGVFLSLVYLFLRFGSNPPDRSEPIS
jgi:hypothetical protein